MAEDLTKRLYVLETQERDDTFSLIERIVTDKENIILPVESSEKFALVSLRKNDNPDDLISIFEQVKPDSYEKGSLGVDTYGYYARVSWDPAIRTEMGHITLRKPSRILGVFSVGDEIYKEALDRFFMEMQNEKVALRGRLKSMLLGDILFDILKVEYGQKIKIR